MIRRIPPQWICNRANGCGRDARAPRRVHTQGMIQYNGSASALSRYSTSLGATHRPDSDDLYIASMALSTSSENFASIIG